MPSIAEWAEALPLRARAELALAVAEAVLPKARGRPLAQRAVQVARCWAEGEAAPWEIDDSLHDEKDEGLEVEMQSIADPGELVVLQALATALCYVSWAGCKLAGESPGAFVSEVGEETLEELDTYLGAIPDFDWTPLKVRAIALGRSGAA